jgi:hypothetical protein
MRHKHADLIHAWADGAEIEIFNCGQWVVVQHPTFSGSLEYRIKPTPKPDVVCYYTADVNNRDVGKILMGDNLKLTFDGETGELKSAEVIK